MPETAEGTLTVKLMTQEEAFSRALVRFGDRASVGYGVLPGQQEQTCHVGWKEHGSWQWIGWGKTFEEAFRNVKKVKTHWRDKLEVYQ
jgi:hypothetical protein